MIGDISNYRTNYNLFVRSALLAVAAFAFLLAVPGTGVAQVLTAQLSATLKTRPAPLFPVRPSPSLKPKPGLSAR